MGDGKTPTQLKSYYPWLYRLWSNKYWVDQIYDHTIARPGRWLANAFWVDVDGRIINGFADGLARGFRKRTLVTAKLMAQVILGEQPDCDLSAFSPRRFAA